MALKTNVYIDAFNLYYGCLRKTPYRWLDLGAFCSRMLTFATVALEPALHRTRLKF